MAQEPRPEQPPQAGISQVDDEWRRWIAENILLDMPPDSIRDAMVANGFSPNVAAEEVNQAMRSPYLKGVEQMRNRLRKRDWLLASYRKANRLHAKANEIERRHKLSRQEFFDDYYTTGRPVIITGMMDDWPAMKKWSLDYFKEKFGDREVEVQTGRNAGDNQFNYEIQREKYVGKMKFADYVEKVRNAGTTNDFYMTATNESYNKKTLPELWDDIVQIPEYLTNDRMAGFFWLGPKGTITPFHHDLTNNFMAQVMGTKRVLVAPSWDLPLMQNFYHVFSRIDGRQVTPLPSPAQDMPQILECHIGPGDILFLPIGCLHFVEGTEISVTVSFTNFLLDNDFSSFYKTFGPV